MKKVLLSISLLLFSVIAWAQDETPTVIGQQPQGTLKLYSRSGSYYHLRRGELTVGDQQGKLVKMVYDADGKTVYLNPPVCAYSTGSWLKGTLSDNGKTLTFAGGQFLDYDEFLELGIQVGYVRDIHEVTDKEEDGEEYTYSTGTIDLESPITYTVGDDGTLTLNGTSDKTCIGIIEDGEAWDEDYHGEFQTVLTPFAEDVVTAPAGLETEDYTMVYAYSNRKDCVQMIKVGYTGNEVYIQGLEEDVPDAWLKGTVSDGIITFAGPQLAGLLKNKPYYWLTATAQKPEKKYVTSLSEQAIFNIDPETKTITPAAIAESDAVYAIVLNEGKEELDEYSTFVAPTMRRFVDQPATPLDPSSVKATFYKTSGDLTFTHRYFSVDSIPLNPANLYYRIYTDNDQLYILKKDYYEDLDTDQQEFSCLLDCYDFYGFNYGSHTATYYENEFERIGVQAVYRGGGEEHTSNIVYNDGTVSGEQTGIAETVRDLKNNGIQQFDLQGRRVRSPYPGQILIIRCTTDDGTVTIHKVVKQ